MNRDILCLIPARSGSKRIPDKNIATVGGVSLLERAVATGIAAFGNVIVSTDSARYAAIARTAGADVPALRPIELAGDDVATDAVARHALTEWRPEATVIVVIQASSPFTAAADVVACVTALREHPDAATALLVSELASTVSYALVSDGATATPLAPSLYDRRSQDLPAIWLPTGGAFAAPAGRVRAGGPLQMGPFAVVPVPKERAIDVDEPGDLVRAQEMAS